MSINSCYYIPTMFFTILIVLLPFSPTLSAGPSFTIESTNTPLKFLSKPLTLSAKSEVNVAAVRPSHGCSIISLFN